jgi:NADP-dependent 3-hydroxy acid dehydrogenase YdfG
MEHVAGLAGVRTLVVGASSGLGRSVARLAVASGARVVAAARRQDLLDELVSEAGGGVALATDITDLAQCQALVAKCVDEFDAIDLVVNVTGVSVLRSIAETSREDWTKVIDTNVVGCNSLIRAAVDHLSSNGIVAAVSSEAVTRPRAGMGAYTASKAALEASLAAWRHERAPIRFSCIAIGATMPTEISNEFDPELLETMLDDWIGTGMMQTAAMPTDDVAFALLGVLASVLRVPDVNIEHLTLRSPTPVVGSMAAKAT